MIDQRPWTPLHIASTSRTKDLGEWAWAPLGRAWALQRRKQLGIGLVVVALTGFHVGRPWCRSDDRRAIDDDAVWLRGLVDGRMVLRPRRLDAGSVWEFACAIQWTENAWRDSSSPP